MMRPAWPLTLFPFLINAFLVLVLETALPSSISERLYQVPQRWASSGTLYTGTDSLAVCRLGNGRVGVFATSKEGNRIDLFDATSGRFLKSLGSLGNRAGQFSRPNGISVVEFPVLRGTSRPYVLVVETKNARVQALCTDTFKPAGTFGSEEMNRPYGIAVSYTEKGIFAYVTDTQAPADRRVHQYRLRLKGNRLLATHMRSFGESGSPGEIRDPESVAVDSRMGHVLFSDEKSTESNVKVYTLDGKFTGTTFGEGHIRGEAEGISILEGPSSGFVVLTDQRQDLTVWHLFDRKTYQYRLSFTGSPRVANTDGICIYPRPFKGFPGGALFAVHDNSDIRAYSLQDIGSFASRL